MQQVHHYPQDDAGEGAGEPKPGGGGDSSSDSNTDNSGTHITTSIMRSPTSWLQSLQESYNSMSSAAMSTLYSVLAIIEFLGLVGLARVWGKHSDFDDPPQYHQPQQHLHPPEQPYRHPDWEWSRNPSLCYNANSNGNSASNNDNQESSNETDNNENNPHADSSQYRAGPVRRALVFVGRWLWAHCDIRSPLQVLFSCLSHVYGCFVVVVYYTIFVHAYALLAVLPDTKLRRIIWNHLRIYTHHAQNVMTLSLQGLWEALPKVSKRTWRRFMTRNDQDEGGSSIFMEDDRDSGGSSSIMCSLCDEAVTISRLASVAYDVPRTETSSASHGATPIHGQQQPQQQSTTASASSSLPLQFGNDVPVARVCCQHVFCTACITRWAHTEWSNHRRATCPFCRCPFTMIVSCSQLSRPNANVDEDEFSLTPLSSQEHTLFCLEYFLVGAFCCVTSHAMTPPGPDNSWFWGQKMILLTLVSPWMARWPPFTVMDCLFLAPLLFWDQISYGVWCVAVFVALAHRDEVRAVRILSGLLIYQAFLHTLLAESTHSAMWKLGEWAFP